MPFKKHPLYRLFLYLGKQRRRQIYILIILLLLNALFESFSLVSIIPFLTIFISSDDIFALPFIGQFYNFLGINEVSQLFFIITTLFCSLIFLSTVLRTFNIWYILRLTAKINLDLSYLLFKNNIYQNYSSYIKKNSSSIISLIIEKVSTSCSALSSIFYTFSSIIIVIALIFSLLLYQWKIIFMISVFLYIYYRIIYKKIKKLLYMNGKIIAENNTNRLKVIQESFLGFRDLIINGTQEVYLNLFHKYESVSKFKNASSDFLIASPKFLIECLSIIIIALICFNFYDVSSNNSLIIPLLGSYIYAFQRLLPLIQQIYAGTASVQYKYANIVELLEELDNSKNCQISIQSKTYLHFKKEISFKDINFSYETNTSKQFNLKKVNLKIHKGEYIGIFGKTGSGKTTFLDIFMGLLYPSNGQILIDNNPISYKDSIYQWTSKISHVSQTIFLKEGSIAENIAFGESAENINYDLMKKSAEIAQIYNFIEETSKGFNTYVGERGIKLSGGQKQRIAIARAIYQRREILVLDEATSALDEKTAEKIMKSILKLRENLTIIMVTHRMNSIKNCDRIFHIKDNSIYEENIT